MPQIQINTPAPDFKLNDFNGQAVQLSSFFGQKNIIMVFNRGFA